MRNYVQFLNGMGSLVPLSMHGCSTPAGLPVKRPTTSVTLNTVVDHIDYICQLAGNSRHAAIGTDLDGGYGREQSPSDLDTIADLQKIPGLLEARGYSAEDIAAIMHGNWLRFLHDAWG